MKTKPENTEAVPNSYEDWQRRGAENPITKHFTVIRRSLSNMLADRRHGNTLFLSSAAGLGKNDLVKKELAGAGIRPLLASPNSALGLIDVLYRAGNGIVLFDECDKWWTAETINILKKACDPVEQNRELVNNVKGNAQTPAHLSGQSFRVRCGIIMLSNINPNEPSRWPKHLHAHLGAITSRVTPQAISDDLRHMWEYTCYLAICEGLLRGQGYSLSVANEALRYFTETMYLAGEASPRRLLRIAQTIASNPSPDDWRILLDSTLPKGREKGNPPEPPQITPALRRAVTLVEVGTEALANVPEHGNSAIPATMVREVA